MASTEDVLNADSEQINETHDILVRTSQDFILQSSLVVYLSFFIQWFIPHYFVSARG